jgi:dCTP diphosphatase
MSDLTDIRDRARAFAMARDWDQLHSPKNLAMALSGEVGELVELFQWLTEEQSRNLTQDPHQKVAHEIADVQIYLVRLADKLGVDIHKTVVEKMAINEKRYPADRVRGRADKYTAYVEPRGD